MNYKQILKKQIDELEHKIANAQGEKAELEKQLTNLKLMEFEEDMRLESPPKVLLKG